MKMVDFDVAEHQYRHNTNIDEDIARLHYPQKYVLLEAFNEIYSLEIQDVTDTAFFLKLTDDAIKHYTRVEEKIMDENKKLKKENEELKKENKRFKKSLIEYKKSVQKLKTEKEQFEVDVRDFMRKKGLNVRVIYLGDKFGVVLNKNTENIFDNPTIPLEVLMEFCDTFDCEYEYMMRELGRYVFKFEGNLHMGS